MAHEVRVIHATSACPSADAKQWFLRARVDCHRGLDLHRSRGGLACPGDHLRDHRILQGVAVSDWRQVALHNDILFAVRDAYRILVGVSPDDGVTSDSVRVIHATSACPSADAIRRLIRTNLISLRRMDIGIRGGHLASARDELGNRLVPDVTVGDRRHIGDQRHGLSASHLVACSVLEYPMQLVRNAHLKSVVGLHAILQVGRPREDTIQFSATVVIRLVRVKVQLLVRDIATSIHNCLERVRVNATAIEERKRRILQDKAQLARIQFRVSVVLTLIDPSNGQFLVVLKVGISTDVSPSIRAIHHALHDRRHKANRIVGGEISVGSDRGHASPHQGILDIRPSQNGASLD